MTDAVRAYFRTQPDRPEPWHDERYAQTAKYLLAVTEGRRPRRVLDVGGQSAFTDLLRHLLPWEVRTTDDWDVRSPVPDDLWPGTWDLVICTEVIEHVHDLHTDDYHGRAMWTGSGQLALMKNLRRLVTPQGRILVTTPNACGLRVLSEVMRGRPPRSFAPHVRELTAGEVADVVAAAGLRVAESGEWTVWAHHGLSETRLRHCREIVGDRGDDLYFLLERNDA